jgi:hypothetical protein
MMYFFRNTPQEMPSPRDTAADFVVEKAAEMKRRPHQRNNKNVIEELPNHG